MKTYLPVFTSPSGETQCRYAYQAVLNRWTTSFEQFDIATSIGETHIIASGDPGNPPLVLIHALFATAASWYSIAGPLSERFRVYAVDVPGEANLSRPSQTVTQLDQMAGWFEELLDRMDVETTFLAGNSYGGFMSAYYAMHAPERVRRLALIGPAATFLPMPQFYLHMFVPKSLYLFLPWMPGVKGIMKRAVNWIHAGLPQDGLWSELFFLNMVYGGMTTRILPRVYTNEELSRIEAPTLLIVGDREKIYKAREVVSTARKSMPAIEVAVIPDAHHITAIAQPQSVSVQLTAFFGGAGKTAPAPVSRMQEPVFSI